MTTIEPRDVVDWLGPEVARLSEDHIQAIRQGWQAYYDSEPVRLREGEDADYAEVDREVTSAVAMVVMGDDLELAELGERLRATRDLLYARVVGAVHAGLGEAPVARAAGIDRMTVRRLLGKR